MKKTGIILISASFLTGLILMSFTTNRDKQNEKINIKEIDKSVVKINDKLCAGKYEVSNKLYCEFLHTLITNNKTDLYNQVRVDSLNWRDKLSFNEPMVELYFRHPAYSEFPLVNVSYESAIKFCEWLTDEYNSNASRKYKKVKFRLPTESEWELAARGGSEYSVYPWGNTLLLKNQPNCNYRYIGDESLRTDSLTNKIIIEDANNMNVAGVLNDRADITAPVDSYKPNKFGIYNICGNVCEMIQTKGVSKGGGWRSPGGDVKIKSRGRYNKSAIDLGFRYFLEIIEK